MTESERSLRDADLRIQCKQALDQCTPVTLRRIAQSLGLYKPYANSEDAGKPWRKRNND